MANGDLVISKQKITFSKVGKRVADYFVGRTSGNGYRVMGDCDGGFVEISNENRVVINDAKKVTISCLGAGVADTYFKSADDISKVVAEFIEGKRLDAVGRNVSQLSWVGAFDKKHAVILSGVPMEEVKKEPKVTLSAEEIMARKAAKMKPKAPEAYAFVIG